MSRKIIVTEPFPRWNRIVPKGSYMNVDKKLYDELVLRRRVAVPLEEWKRLQKKGESARVQAMVEEIETAAERIAEEQKAESVQHVVVHHINELEEEE